eukprot:4551315-Ditylum_brightwellii.AAC.1
MRKFFPGFGWYKGEVIEQNGDIFTIHFEDNEEELWSPADMEKYEAVANIPIRGLGFQFVKKFGAA